MSSLKINNINRYWLYVEPYCFIFTESNKVLVYNTLSYSKDEKILSERLNKIITELKSTKNLYCTEVSKSDLEDISIKSFINALIENYSGDLVDASLSNTKPAIMLPELKLQGQLKDLKKMKNISNGSNILTYLTDILLQINGECQNDCKYCKTAYKQTVFCTKNSQELDIQAINKVIYQIEGTNIRNINITGGNIFYYSELKKLISLLNDTECNINYHIHYKNVVNNIENISWFKNSNSSLTIKVDFPLNEAKIKNVSSVLKSEMVNFSWHFLIASIIEYEKCEAICANYNLENIEISPIIDDNIGFFEEYIYLNKEDIYDVKDSRKDIFAKSILNLNHFGKFIIMSDKHVYANINNKKIGTIEQSFSELVQIELSDGKSWLSYRNKEPCTDCVYQFLCPSPSNYELLLDKPNLCRIK